MLEVLQKILFKPQTEGDPPLIIESPINDPETMKDIKETDKVGTNKRKFSKKKEVKNGGGNNEDKNKDNENVNKVDKNEDKKKEENNTKEDVKEPENKAETTKTDKEKQEEKAKEEEEKKFPWRKPLVEEEKVKWRKELLGKIELERQAGLLLQAKQKWRASLIAGLTEDVLWKAELILNAIDEDHGNLMVNTDNDCEVEAVARVTEENYWKLNLFRCLPVSLPWTVKFVDLCESEDLGNLITKCSKQWQFSTLAANPSMEVWRADCLANCNWSWQGPLILKCQWELQARAVASVKDEWVGLALCRVVQEEEWKLVVVAGLKAQWLMEPVLAETNEKVARLIASMKDQKRLKSLLSCCPLEEEWKIQILGGDLDEWKFQMLLTVHNEEKAFVIEKSKSKTVCKMLAQAEESWRLNALCEAANGGFWLADIVSRVSEEWQARLLLLGHREKMDKWRLEQLPNITHENMAVNFLYSTRCYFPRWKFELGLKIAQEDDPLLQLKAEFLFRDSSPRWMVEMAARCTEEWQLQYLQKVTNRGVGELYMSACEEWRGAMLAGVTELWKAELVAAVPQEWKVLLMLQYARREEQWRLKLVLPLTTEWQVKFVFVASDTWKAEMIASLSSKDEMRGRELLDCSTREFAQEVMGGLLDVYYA